MSERFRINKKFEINEDPKKKFEIHRERMGDSTPLSEVESINEGGSSPKSREALSGLVEAPLLEACESLFDKNIQTVFSSANKDDIRSGEVYITIDYDSLTPANQMVARSLGEIHKTHGSEPKNAVNLTIRVSPETTVGEIRKAAVQIISKFESQ